jgi:small subunit ribosomal protein S13
MTRISGVTIPTEKQIQIALTYVYGIGPRVASEVLEKAKIEPTTDSDYLVEGNLQRQVTNNIKRLKDINAYRGLRHKAGLPVRGQRTRTNARTHKGKGVAVGGAQKKAASKT